MPKLTGKELSELYPKAKTFDQLRAETAQIQEMRRPRWVPLKIALLVTLCAVAVLATYHFILHIMGGGMGGDALSVLVDVCFSGLVLAGGLATVWYFYSLIDDLASKTIVAPSLLYTALVAILLLAGAAFGVLWHYLQDETIAVAMLLGSSFVLSLLAVMSILKNQ